MIENLPNWIEIFFITITVLTIALFYFSNGRPKTVTILLVIWSIAHGVLAYNGFYLDTKAMPPRFGLVLLPATLFLIYGALPKQRDWVFRKRDTELSTFVYIVRFPVEIVLFQLYLHKAIPELMTFEGRNFDILAGITAPIIGWLYNKNKISKRLLLLWNYIGLFLVLFILINGVLSAELPFQQFAFEQPNRDIAYFPFVLLPATIVPIVIWTHLTNIFKLREVLKSSTSLNR